MAPPSDAAGEPGRKERSAAAAALPSRPGWVCWGLQQVASEESVTRVVPPRAGREPLGLLACSCAFRHRGRSPAPPSGVGEAAGRTPSQPPPPPLRMVRCFRQAKVQSNPKRLISGAEDREREREKAPPVLRKAKQAFLSRVGEAKPEPPPSAVAARQPMSSRTHSTEVAGLRSREASRINSLKHGMAPTYSSGGGGGKRGGISF